MKRLKGHHLPNLADVMNTYVKDASSATQNPMSTIMTTGI